MGYEPLEEKRMCQRAEGLTDGVWELVAGWPEFAKRTVGAQLVRAADSIGANIAEAGGRFHPGEVRTFLYYARGSLSETRYWLRRAAQRTFLDAEPFARMDTELTELALEINAAIRFQRSRRTPPKG